MANLLFIVALAFLAAAPRASAKSSDIAELYAMDRSMQQTFAEQNARIATLEKQ